MNVFMTVDQISAKQMIAELTNASFKGPAIPRRDVLAAQFIAGAALTGLPKVEVEK